MRIALGLATLALTLTACGGNNAAPTTADSPTPAESSTAATLAASGSIVGGIDLTSVIKADSPTIGTTPCKSLSAGIQKGAQVTVSDATGATVGLGTLDAGTLFGKDGDTLLTSECKFTFSVYGIPAGSAFYKFAMDGATDVTVPASGLSEVVLKPSS